MMMGRMRMMGVMLACMLGAGAVQGASLTTTPVLARPDGRIYSPTGDLASANGWVKTNELAAAQLAAWTAASNLAQLAISGRATTQQVAIAVSNSAVTFSNLVRAATNGVTRMSQLIAATNGVAYRWDLKGSNSFEVWTPVITTNLGPELVVNGDFAAGLDGWSSSSWGVSGGRAEWSTTTPGQFGTLEQYVDTGDGGVFRVVVYSEWSTNFYLSGSFGGNALGLGSSSGIVVTNFTEVVDGTLSFVGEGVGHDGNDDPVSASFVVDNVSVRKLNFTTNWVRAMVVADNTIRGAFAGDASKLTNFPIASSIASVNTKTNNVTAAGVNVMDFVGFTTTKEGSTLHLGIPYPDSDVRYYGAKGDGFTDDTLAVKAAYDHAVTLGGGSIYFPKTSGGSYLFNITITNSGITFIGSGGFAADFTNGIAGYSDMRPFDITKPVITVGSINHAIVQGFNLQNCSISAYRGTTNGAGCVRFAHCTRAFSDNCSFFGGTNALNFENEMSSGIVQLVFVSHFKAVSWGGQAVRAVRNTGGSGHLTSVYLSSGHIWGQADHFAIEVQRHMLYLTDVYCDLKDNKGVFTSDGGQIGGNNYTLDMYMSDGHYTDALGVYTNKVMIVSNDSTMELSRYLSGTMNNTKGQVWLSTYGLNVNVGGNPARNLSLSLESPYLYRATINAEDFVYFSDNSNPFSTNCFLLRWYTNLVLSAFDGGVIVKPKLIASGTFSAPSLNSDSYSVASFVADGYSQLAVSAQGNYPYSMSMQSKGTIGDNTAKPLLVNPLGGSVWVGTNDSVEKFAVCGDISAAGYIVGYRMKSLGDYSNPSLLKNSPALANFVAAGYSQLAVSSQGNWPYTLSLQGKLADGDNSACPVAINPMGGGVGVGTTNPATALDVVGSIQASGSINAAGSLTTNLQVLVPGSKTNTMYFTNGILYRVTNP